MKVLVGSPGTISGLLLRIGQSLFAAASIGVMVSALGFSNYTAFCYLIAAMGLQLLWSSGLAALDVYALLIKRDLHNPALVSLFVVGDWEEDVEPGFIPCDNAWSASKGRPYERRGDGDSIAGGSGVLGGGGSSVCKGCAILQYNGAVPMQDV